MKFLWTEQPAKMQAGPLVYIRSVVSEPFLFLGGRRQQIEVGLGSMTATPSVCGVPIRSSGVRGIVWRVCLLSVYLHLQGGLICTYSRASLNYRTFSYIKKTRSVKVREKEKKKKPLPSDSSVDSADSRENDDADPKTSGIAKRLSEFDRWTGRCK